MSERTTKSSSLLIRILKVVGISLTAIILTLAIIVGIFSWRTESEISNFKQNVIDVSEGNPARSTPNLIFLACQSRSKSISNSPSWAANLPRPM